MQEVTNYNKIPSDLPQSLCANMCQCIIEEMLHELFILQRISNGLKKGNAENVSNKTVLSQNMKSSATQITERDKHNLVTFEKNCIFIEKTLQTLYEELVSKGVYEKFSEIVETLGKSKIEEKNLKEETMKMQAELKQLEYTLYQEERLYHTKIVECMADIGKIKDEIEVCLYLLFFLISL